jgi:hypothetical protein
MEGFLYLQRILFRSIDCLLILCNSKVESVRYNDIIINLLYSVTI